MKKTNLVLILVAALSVAACNTVVGLGQDAVIGARAVQGLF